jgi:hypothetical protein
MGTVAHALAAEILWDEKTTLTAGITVEQDGFEIEITPEMLEAVRGYTNYCESLAQQWNTQPLIEHSISIPEKPDLAEGWQLTNPPKMFGTADFILTVPYNRMYVGDYKNGVNVVNAYRNKQLMYYMLGALFALPKDERQEIPVCEGFIYQPNGLGLRNPVSTFEIETKELLEDWHPQLVERMKAAERDDAPLNAGAWCKYCPAAVSCPALRAEMKSITTVAFEQDEKIHMPVPENLSVSSVLAVLEKGKMVRDWLSSVEDHALNLFQKNGEDKAKLQEAGYGLTERFGHQKWSEELIARKVLTDALGDKATTLISPNQAGIALKKEKIADIVKLPATVKPFIGYALKKGAAGGTKAFDGIDEDQ